MLRFSSKVGSWSELKADCKPVRLAVFVNEQNVPSAIELDELDAHYQHIVIFDDTEKPIATARLSADGKFGRMAVLKPYRLQGIGKQLLNLIYGQATSLQLKQLCCHAQLTAQVFYEKNGFLCVGEPIQEAGIEHIKMVKKL
ncbi:MAG: GNAT family N-acetyltransferase [Cycloclasticus sp.]|nr:GNAT family N-acetyltransferase [Cycloclasticus sp.]